MSAETIVVEFVPDTSQIDSATSQLSEQEQKTIADGNAELTKRAQILKQNVTGYAQELAASKAVNDSLQKQLASAKTIRDQVILLGNALDAAFAAGGNAGVNEVFKALESQLQGTGLSVEQFVDQLKKLDPATSTLADKSETARSRLAAMREELVRMREAGQADTDAYRQLTAQAGELSDAIGDVNEEFRAAGSDTAGIDKVIRGTQLLTAGFGLAQGAAAAFGDTDQELQQTLIKVNGVMTILNSLQQLQTELVRKDNVVKQLQIALQNGWTAAIEGTTAAFGSLAPAIIATGIGAIVVAVAAVVIAYKNWAAASREVEAENENLKNQIDIINAGIQGQVNAIKNQTDIAVEQAKRQTNSDKAVFNIQQQGYARQIAAQKAVTAELVNNANKVKDNADLRAQYDQAIIDSNQKVNDLQKQSELTHQQFLTQQYEKYKELAQANAKAEEDISLAKYDYLSNLAQQTANNDKLSYDQRADALQSWIDDEKKKLQIQADYELSQPKLTASQIEAIKTKHYYDLKTLQDQYQQESIKLADDYNKQQINDANATAVALAKAQLDGAREGTREELQLKNELLLKEAQQQIAAANQNIQNETLREATIKQINADTNKQILDNDKEYYQKKRQQDQEYMESIDDLIVARNKLSVAGLDSQSTQVFENEQQNKYILLNETNKKIADMQAEFRNGQLIADEENLTKYNKLLTDQANQEVEIAQAAADRKRKIDQAYRDAALEVAQDISDAIFDINKQNTQADLDNKINALEKQKSAELNNENLTEQQKDAITARYEKLEAQAKQQAAIKQKQADTAQAIINGILAVTKALASSFPPFNFINAAVVAAATAVQVAKIRSTPIPQFAKGTKNAPRGAAWVGEEGPELIYLKGGETIIPNKESMNIVRNQYFSTPSVPKEYLSMKSNSSTDPKIDYDKLASKIGKHVAANVPRHGVNIDENGFKVWVQKGGNKTAYKNKRYTL